MIQKTEWGYINWIRTNKEELESFNVGISVLEEGKRMPPHVHYGAEQFLYILEGKATYYIDSEKIEIEKGMYIYLKPDIVHEAINMGDGPFSELLISRPVSYSDMDLYESNTHKSVIASGEMNNIIYAAVEAIRTTLLEDISLPFTIFDDMWSSVIQANHFSNYCHMKCDPVNNKDCSCLRQRKLEEEKNSQFICEYGLTVLSFPIVFNGIKLGTIIGGHILMSDGTAHSHCRHRNQRRRSLAIAEG